MNITKENISELELLLKVEISESDYKEKVGKQLKEYQKKAAVPGFRKGMAPLPLIKKMYQKAIVADEVQGILSESLYKYIEDEKLEIVGSPLSNDEKTGEINFDDTDFVFYFDAAIMPQVEIKWNELGVKMTQIKVSSKDIDEQITDIAQRYGKFETPETVEETDYVYGKAVELDKDGNAKEGGVNTFISMDVAKIKNNDIKQQFIGKKAEDKIVFNVGKALDAETIEKSFRLEKEIAKKFKSDVEVTLSGISRITPHEVNEELFQKVFPKEEVKDIDTFKKLLKKEAEKAYGEQTQMLFNVEVRKALIEQFSAEIPTEFIQRWIASRGEKDVTIDTVKAEWEEKYLSAIKWEFIEAQIRKIKDIDPTQNEVVDYVKGIMTAHDLRKEDEDEKAYDERIEKAARSIAQDRNNVGQIYEKIYSDKMFALLNEQIKPEVEKITIKEFAERNK
jgi:trigger factor